jgi:16S rRNA (cytidine1402-2'-O)-methyltransferase
MHTTQPGKLYLIPLPIAPNTQEQVIPAQVKLIIQGIDYFLVENIRTARRYITATGHPKSIDELVFILLDKETSTEQVAIYMKPVLEGKDVGVLAEAGCPGIADPGALAVQYAHQQQIEVVPLVGPCSIILALMASGLNGQSFAFHGYLPIHKEQRQKAIKKLERDAWQLGQTQICIETPYRNQALLSDLLQVCQPHTLLSIGKNITAQDGWTKTQTIQQWQKGKTNLHKSPAVFLIAKPHATL